MQIHFQTHKVFLYLVSCTHAHVITLCREMSNKQLQSVKPLHSTGCNCEIYAWIARGPECQPMEDYENPCISYTVGC